MAFLAQIHHRQSIIVYYIYATAATAASVVDSVADAAAVADAVEEEC